VKLHALKGGVKGHLPANESSKEAAEKVICFRLLKKDQMQGPRNREE
jgi:hypothetical protein